jgi:hypothetical protein
MIQLKIKVSLFESDIIQVGIHQNFTLEVAPSGHQVKYIFNENGNGHKISPGQ